MQRLKVRADRRHEDGFTLVELIVTVAIIGVVVSSLTGVVISYLRNTVDTQARLTESQDVQFAAAYWQRDVASIGVRSATYDTASHSFPLVQSIGVTPTCTLPAGTQVVTLAWSDYSSLVSADTPATVTVTYVSKNDGSGFDLTRVRCTGPTVDSAVEVAHSLTSVPAAPVCSGPGGSSCTGIGAYVPTVVKLSLSVLDPTGHGTTPYMATLAGERRQT